MTRRGLLSMVAAGAAAGAESERIASFWRGTLARLAAAPLAPKVEDTREPLPYKKYRVSYASLGGHRVEALLALPIRGGRPAGSAGRLPAIVTAPGYSGRQQGVMLDECQRGYAVLQVFPRAAAASEERLLDGIDAPEGAYYQGAYADVLAGLAWLRTRPEADAERIAMVGTSQGGGIALAVAALDGRVKTVVSHVPFLCDMRRAAATEGSLIRSTLEKAGRLDERALATLDYFDPLHLVGGLDVPVLLSAGGKDGTCPAATIRAVHARLPGVKALFEDPDLPHTTSLPFYELTWPWLDLYLR